MNTIGGGLQIPWDGGANWTDWRMDWSRLLLLIGNKYIMKDVKQLFTEQLSLIGFKKKSKDWLYENGELIIVINLQKSNYEILYFLNIGIWLNEIGGVNPAPKENICHIRIRAERLFESIPQKLNPRELFDFNNSISKEKLLDINNFLINFLCPVLIRLTTINSLKKLFDENLFRYAYIEKKARLLLEQSR